MHLVNPEFALQNDINWLATFTSKLTTPLFLGIFIIN